MNYIYQNIKLNKNVMYQKLSYYVIKFKHHLANRLSLLFIYNDGRTSNHVSDSFQHV